MVPSVMAVAALLLSFTTASLHPESAKFLLYPHLYEVLGKANPFMKHVLIFAVQQLNIDVLQSILQSVANVSDPSYGQYLSRDEVASLTSNPVSTEYVTNYLHDRGISIIRTTRHGEYIVASASVYEWEVMLQTIFYSVKTLTKSSTSHTRQQTSVRASRFSTPNDLVPHITTILNIIETPLFQRQRMSVSGNALTKQNIAEISFNTRNPGHPYDDKNKVRITGFTYPGLINKFYNISSNKGSLLASQAVFETSGQTFSSVDMAIFENAFSLPTSQPNGDINGHITNKACLGVDNCAEANLDVEYLMAIAQNVSTTYVQTPSVFVHSIMESQLSSTIISFLTKIPLNIMTRNIRFWYSGESASAAFTDWIVEVADVTLPPQVLFYIKIFIFIVIYLHTVWIYFSDNCCANVILILGMGMNISCVFQIKIFII